MDWLNIHRQFLDSPQFLGAKPVSRATWLCLFSFCAGQENGGRIDGCKLWDDRKWQQLVRVTLEEVKCETELWSWDGDTLVVFNYPLEKEIQVKGRRASGRIGGMAVTQAKTEAAQRNGALGGRPVTQARTEADPNRNPSENPTEGKEKEKGKGKGNEKGNPNSPVGSESEFEEIWKLYPKKAGKQGAKAKIVAAIQAHGFTHVRERVAAFAAAVAAWPAEDRCFVKDPVKFFRDGHYDDDPVTWVKNSPPGAAGKNRAFDQQLTDIDTLHANRSQ